MAFVMVLSWSRQVFLQFFLDARMESFLRGHIAAFHVWNGLPRILLYDNLLCGAPHKRFYVEHSVM
jgi:transposase